jgi:hypothetical protein
LDWQMSARCIHLELWKEIQGNFHIIGLADHDERTFIHSFRFAKLDLILPQHRTESPPAVFKNGIDI